MRVVYLSVSGQRGGAERCLLDALTGIRDAQRDWSLSLVLGADGPLRSRASALGVPPTVVAFPGAVARLGETGVDGRGGGFAIGHRFVVAGLTATSYLRSDGSIAAIKGAGRPSAFSRLT